MLKEQEKEHWVFSFDLKVDDIKNFYKGSAYNHAYDEIRNFLFKNGFNNGEMKEGSVYITAEPMYQKDVIRTINNMFNKLPWLPECINKAAISTLPRQVYDFKEYADEYKNDPKHIKAYMKYCQKHSNETKQENKENYFRNNTRRR